MADPVQVALAVVLKGGKVLLVRRRAGVYLQGLWEFPGGKIRAGEEPKAAALRELREETGLEGCRAVPLGAILHSYPDLQVHLQAFLVEETRGQIQIASGEPARWLRPLEIDPGLMPAANGGLLARLLELDRGP